MNLLRQLYSRSLLCYLWQEFLLRYRFKYVLPKITETVLDGIRLDLTRLPVKVRNRILLGLYEAHERQMCQKHLTPEDVVLEIGGAIGYIGLFCQKTIGVRHYFVVEANPDTLSILQSNYRLNGVSPKAWNVALAPCNGPLDLQIDGDFWDNSVIPTPATIPRRATISVSGVTFASLLRMVDAPVSALIVDVEGAEQFIDLNELPEAIDKIIIELHPRALGPRKMYDLIAGFLQRGFYVADENQATFTFLKCRSADDPIRPSRLRPPSVEGERAVSRAAARLVEMHSR